MYRFSCRTGAIPTPIGLNNVRRDLCCFLLPHFHGGSVMLKGFSVQPLHSPTVIPLPQLAWQGAGDLPCTPITQPALLCVGTKKTRLFIFSPLNHSLPLFFFLWKLLIKEPERGKTPVQGPLTATSIYMGKSILNHFSVVCMWLLVPALERCTGRHLLQKEKFQSCFCFSPFLFLLSCLSCLVGAALQPLIHTVCSFSAFRSGCKRFLQGRAMMQEQSKETTEISWYVFHNLNRYKSPYFLGKGKMGSKFLFVHREMERYCSRRVLEQWGNVEK